MRVSLIIISILLSFQLKSQYFQQEVNYDIKVRLDDKKHVLHAFEEFEYHNKSRDTLSEIIIHLWPNAYKGRGTALEKQLSEDGNFILRFPSESEIGYIDSLDFRSGEAKLQLSYFEEDPDIAKLKLDKPLFPGRSVVISTPFRVKIPSGNISRLGHVYQQYQITQWYPKPAVYDEEGWHPMPYLNQGEFYSEFGSFDVQITLPKNYVLGSTGNLINPEEIEWLDSLAQVVPDEEEWKKRSEFPESSTEMKTLMYSAKNVHDFAWFCDKRYRVTKSEVELPESKRKVTTWAMFSPMGGEHWKNANEYLNDAVYYYSLWNGEYAYDHMTAVEGALSAGAGMEYPNITVIGSAGSAIMLEEVIMHETGHQWFYGMLGSNERVHPWMDEGMNSYCEIRYMETKHPGKGFDIPDGVRKAFQLEDFDHYTYHYLSYAFISRANKDQPIELHSADYSSLNYGAIVYSKSAVWFRYLQDYLGEEKMNQCLKNYFQEWHFRHPQPSDLQKSFEATSGEDLSWFFNSLTTTDKFDLKLKGKRIEGGVQVRLKNKADLDFPAPVSLWKGDSLVAKKWMRPGKMDLVGSGTTLKIDPNARIPDINKQNDQFKTKGLLRGFEKPKLKFLGALDDPTRSELFFTPIYGYTSADGSMLGLAFYNRSLMKKKFEWLLAPMYAIHSERIVAAAQFRLQLIPDKQLFREVELGFDGRRFSWAGLSPIVKNGEFVIQDYNRISPYLRIKHNKTVRKNKWSNSSELRAIYIYNSIMAPLDITQATDLLGVFSHSMKRDKGFLKHEFMFNAVAGDGLLNTDITLVQNWVYNRKGKQISHRLFAGNSWENTRGLFYDYHVSGQNGNYDYAFNQLFLDRAGVSSFWSNQAQFNHGGSKADFGGIQSSPFILGVNMEVDAPISLGIGAYTNVVFDQNFDYYADAGLYLRIIPGICTVYAPLIYQAQKGTAGWQGPSLSQIRFTLQLNRLNPFKLIDSLEI